MYKTILIILCSALSLQAQKAHQYLLKGDRAYDKSNYKDAEAQYRLAADAEYADPRTVYNLGNALYQQGNWEEATTRYKQIANENSDPNLRADINHNLGNAYMQQQQYSEAVNAYKTSLKARPGDADTKKNLQMAIKKKKEQDAQKKQQEQQNQQQPNGNPPPQDQSNQQPNQQQPNQPDPNEEGSEGDREKEIELDKEEAKQLLETAITPADKKTAKKYKENQSKKKEKPNVKDW